MRIFFLIIFLSFTSFVHSQSVLPEEVKKEVNSRIEKGINQSIVICLIEEKGARFYSFGTTKEGGSKVNEHTVFEIGSISKVFTTILLAKELKKGKMKLDDPITKYLPESVSVPVDGKNAIRLSNLADHTSALPRLPSNMRPSDSQNPYADYTVDNMYQFLSSYKLIRDIGAEYEYSNLAMGLLGHILSLANNTTYGNLVSSLAMELGMNETKVNLDGKMKSALATGHDAGRAVKNWDIPTLAGAGAIKSSAADMCLFIQANLGLLDSELYPAMQLTHEVRHAKAGAARVGLGWHISKGDLGDIIWHNGGTGGYRSFAGFVNESKKGVVVLTNSTQGVDDIGFKLLSPSASLTTAKGDIAVLLRKTIDEKGIHPALLLYSRLRDGKEYRIVESSINDLGYHYIETHLPTALAIFKVNLDEHPDSWNVYDSYAEALLLDGKKELAIENYKKSIELNPANENGIQALKELGVKVDTEDFSVETEILETYVGKYQLTPQFFIVVSREEDRLYLQATGQPRFEMFPKNQTDFYLKVVAAQIKFKVTGSTVESLTLYQNGQALLGKKIE